MEELFDVCDDLGRPTGQIRPRSEVHRLGLFHRSAHLWLANSAGEVLLQRRHPDKETDPGRWDIAAAGHLSAGQTALQAMVREAWEELGLTLDPATLHPLTQRRKEYREGGFFDREVQSVFATRHEVELASLVLQPTEVTEAAWMPAEELARRLEAGDTAFVDRRGEWQEVYRFWGLFR
jgi:isopentenyldiphosphate isomerase